MRSVDFAGKGGEAGSGDVCRLSIGKAAGYPYGASIGGGSLSRRRSSATVQDGDGREECAQCGTNGKANLT